MAEEKFIPEIAEPYKRHLILDLDSTLVCASDEMDKYERLALHSDRRRVSDGLRERLFTFELVDVVNAPGSGIKTQMWGVFRPHLKDFIQFVSLYFDTVHVWSAGQHKYVHAIADQIFRYADIQPKTIFVCEDCIIEGDNITKPVSKIMRNYPYLGLTFKNTFCVDDREDTFSQNFKNGILIPPYEPEPTIKELEKDDIALSQLMCWLSLPYVVKAKDVRILKKETIFTTALEDYSEALEKSKGQYPSHFYLYS